MLPNSSQTSSLDGGTITNLNVQDYRKYLTLVSQEPALCSGTVRLNDLLSAIKLHDLKVSQEAEM